MSRKPKYFGCSVPNCKGAHRSLGFCDKHYQLYRKYGDTQTRIRPVGSKRLRSDGYTIVLGKLEHIAIAERAMGKSLPKGAQVHHVNGIRNDNRNINLIVCPNDSYHRLIEKRTRAYEACGHANYVKCFICKEYDDPKNLFISTEGNGYHRKCYRIFRNKKYHENKSREAIKACGNPNYRKCSYCEKWDDPKMLSSGRHLECFSASLTDSWTNSRKEQTRKVKVLIEGIEYSVADLSTKYNIKRETIVARANRGLPFNMVIIKGVKYANNKRKFLETLNDINQRYEALDNDKPTRS